MKGGRTQKHLTISTTGILLSAKGVVRIQNKTTISNKGVTRII